MSGGAPGDPSRFVRSSRGLYPPCPGQRKRGRSLSEATGFRGQLPIWTYRLLRPICIPDELYRFARTRGYRYWRWPTLGIGAAICRAFAEEGCNIFFTINSAFDARYHLGSSTEAYSKHFAEQLRKLGVSAGYMDVDLSEQDAFQRLLDVAWCFLETPDVLVNNAAFSAPDGYERLTTDLLDAHYYVNVRAALMLSVGFARRFRGDDGGRIINLTSGQDLGPMPGELHCFGDIRMSR